MTITDALQDHFNRGWRMIDATIAATPESAWRTAGKGYLCPARLAYHIAETAEFYVSDDTEFPFGARFGGDWEELTPEQLPTISNAIAYLCDAKTWVGQWLSRFDDASILAPSDRFHHCGETYLERALYILRHTLHHHGEMNALSVLEGSDTDNWG